MNEALFWIILSIVLFSIAMFIYQRHPRVWTLPILTVTAVLILILVYSGVSHAEYMQGGQYLSKMLGPAITAFAIPLSGFVIMFGAFYSNRTWCSPWNMHCHDL
ncbi:LrgB family protein [Exiguobacterium sp. SL14]|nr:LrgB family protein [Exiguobacterium sp. SL14]MCY1691745.1 LrgB family protein [Exiguobacterium sp. SL14]